ncbi:hypothetical protein ACVWXQ_004295 [Bradyrhizobium sp. S3.14.4]
MSKTAPPIPLIPPPMVSAPRSSPQKMLVRGSRQSGITTVIFIVRPKRGVDDQLMIGLEEHNGESRSQLMIRGGAEAREMPSQLRWLAEKIEKELGKHDAPSIHEYVLSTGGA